MCSSVHSTKASPRFIGFAVHARARAAHRVEQPVRPIEPLELLQAIPCRDGLVRARMPSSGCAHAGGIRRRAVVPVVVRPAGMDEAPAPGAGSSKAQELQA